MRFTTCITLRPNDAADIRLHCDQWAYASTRVGRTVSRILDIRDRSGRFSATSNRADLSMPQSPTIEMEWTVVPASPPLRLTTRACLDNHCRECGLPVYRRESEEPPKPGSSERNPVRLALQRFADTAPRSGACTFESRFSFCSRFSGWLLPPSCRWRSPLSSGAITIGTRCG
jgi:hypothetical protein